MKRFFWPKIISFILVVFFIGLLLWLVNKNFPLSGQLEITGQPGKDLPMLSRLGPDPRIKLVKDYQIVLDNQVYFDLRSLPWFEKIRIKLIFRPAGRKLDGIGGQTGPGFQYDLKKPLLITDVSGNWQEAIFDFSAAKIYQQKNVRRFLISSSQIDPNIPGELIIKSLEISLIR
ncbi:MAG: hypothetical protein WCX08_02460 [Candidatus Buchananbacteria bacterium]